MKVLVLDDEVSLLDSLRTLLTGHDHDVVCAGNAKDALALVNDRTFDVILVDYKMPENDGLWFMKNARLSRQTKVLLMTAHVNRQVINQMFELGASGYLIKPFNEEDLLRHLSFCASGE
jgi:CheY-like chemotaxis protein